MSATLQQIFVLNPTTVINDTDLFYLVQSPYTPGTDAGILGSDLKIALGAGTVTSIAGGAGITLSPNPITTTGTVSLSIPVLVTRGGTGLTSTTINQLLYSSSNNVIAGLATANNGLLVTSNTGVPSILAGPGTTGNILQSNAAAPPSFSTATYPSTAANAGRILRADGTNWVQSTSTFADTYAINSILYNASANTVSGLSSVARSVLTTNSSSVPTYIALTDGQLVIGSTAGSPAAASLSAGTGISITPGSNSITISNTGGTVTSISAGTGITLTPNPITSTGSVALTIPVVETSGGTGQTTYVLGDTLYASASNTLSKLAGNITAVKQYLSQTGTGIVSAAPSWATISGSDITGAALTKTDDTNVTLTLGGTPTTALLRATSLTLGWTGELSLTRGGTNASLTASNGGIVWSNATQLQILSGTATASKMLLSGATATPSWSTSTIPSSAGATANKVLLSDGTNYVLSTPTFPNASATTGKIIISDGTNWIASTPTFPNSATSTGTILRADGTNWVATTATYPATTTINQILYSSAANVISGITTANIGLLTTNGSGVPSITAFNAVTAAGTSTTTLAANTFTKVTLAESFDIGGVFASSTFTAAVAGIYNVHWQVYISSANLVATNLYYSALYKNGSIHRGGNISPPLGSNYASHGSVAVTIAVNDTLELYFFNGNAATTIDVANNGSLTYFSVVYAGPSS